jgi:hypothetical protein
MIRMKTRKGGHPARVTDSIVYVSKSRFFGEKKGKMDM